MDSNLHIFTEIRENGIWKTFKDKSYPEFEFLNQKVEEIKKNDKEYIKFLFSDEYKSERMNLKLPSKKKSQVDKHRKERLFNVRYTQ